MKKRFDQLQNGEVFQFNGVEYKKVPDVKISCCRTINAEATTNNQQQTFIAPLQEVEVNDQL